MGVRVLGSGVGVCVASAVAVDPIDTPWRVSTISGIYANSLKASRDNKPSQPLPVSRALRILGTDANVKQTIAQPYLSAKRPNAAASLRRCLSVCTAHSIRLIIDTDGA